MAHHPPAYCKSCGLLFPVTLIEVGVGGRVALAGNMINCPKCGAGAEILDGTYEHLGDKLAVFLAPTVSSEARQALLALVQKLQANEISLNIAKREAERLAPGLGKIFDIAHWSREAKATLFGSILLAGATLAAPLLTPAPKVDVHIEMVVPKAGPPSIQRPAAHHSLRERLLYGSSHQTFPPPPRPKPPIPTDE
jgi:hypothetical protein